MESAEKYLQMPGFERGKVNREILSVMLADGLKQKDCASIFGVSEGAISRHVKILQQEIDKEVALYGGASLLRPQVESIWEQLQALNRQTQRFLALGDLALDGEAREQSEARSKLRSMLGSRGNLLGEVIKFQGELRKQLEFSFTQIKEIYGIKQVQVFQEIALEEIRAADPEVAARIVARLRKISDAQDALGGPSEF